MTTKVLAVDVGGTKVHVATYSQDHTPLPTKEHEAFYASGDFPNLDAIILDYRKKFQSKFAAVGVGVAGPVVDGVVEVTNLPWVIRQAELQESLGCPAVLANDIVVQAYGLQSLDPQQCVVLQKGIERRGNKALIAPGTGLGEGFLIWDGQQYRASGSEGGHTDLAPRSSEDLPVLEYFFELFNDRVSYERMLGGAFGFRALYLYYTRKKNFSQIREAEALIEQVERADLGPVIGMGLVSQHPTAVQVLVTYRSFLAAEAGNLALKILALGGVYVAGGITRKLVSFLSHEDFLKDFLRKGRFSSLVAEMPLVFIVDKDLALKGAAALASERLLPL